MEIKVFDISEDAYEEKLEKKDIQNIKKVFQKIFSSENADHLRIDCSAREDSILNKYMNSKTIFNMYEFAESLRGAELKKDGTRNKQITKGNLFIKKEDEQLILLKLENIEVVDKEKNYEMKTSFSTEANYYKGCIFDGNLNKVVIIDRNKTIAKYWREDFLKLSLNRDSYQNSIDLIDLLKENKLFSENISSKGNLQEIKEATENYIFKNESFDKTQLKELLVEKSLIRDTELNLVYSESSKNIDTGFEISKKAIKKRYHKEIFVSEDTKIWTDNYEKLIRRQGIEYEDGKIILSVSEKFVNNLPKELTNGN
ncbi:hypothetical protein NG859_06380 [Enterococcus faecalis]|uniref:hypothetical protein n=1 Tax=Enterococcus faecalis TaxID=1351 RepID=UPI0020900459|nr:hypothetical protein [Enterococcus faecalis]MCO5421387.1 hypothetical protein [Enterococcus faecalis]